MEEPEVEMDEGAVIGEPEGAVEQIEGAEGIAGGMELDGGEAVGLGIEGLKLDGLAGEGAGLLEIAIAGVEGGESEGAHGGVGGMAHVGEELLLDTRGQIPHAGDGQGGTDADPADRIREEGLRLFGGDVACPEEADGGGADHGLLVAEGIGENLEDLLVGRGILEHVDEGGFPPAVLLRADGLLEAGEGTFLAVPEVLHEAGLGAAVGIHVRAVPFLGVPEVPLDGLGIVALGTGIGNAQFDIEAGIRDAEGMVAARVASHEGRGGHVALDAAVAHGIARVATVGDGINLGGVVEAAAVAALAEGVVFHRQDELGRVRIMTIHAGHPGMPHLAHGKGTVDVVFPDDLPVRVVDALDVAQGQVEVVLKDIAGDKAVRGELVPAGVAGGAGLHDLAGREDFLVLVVAVTDLLEVGMGTGMALGAGDGHVVPFAVIAVGLRTEVLEVLRHVAVGAVGVPVHALSGPVAPFAGDPGFLAGILPFKDGEPFLLFDIPGHVMGLDAPVRGEVKILDERGDPDGPDHRHVRNTGLLQDHGVGVGVPAHPVLFQQVTGVGLEALPVNIRERGIGEGVVGVFPLPGGLAVALDALGGIGMLHPGGGELFQDGIQLFEFGRGRFIFQENVEDRGGQEAGDHDGRELGSVHQFGKIRGLGDWTSRRVRFQIDRRGAAGQPGPRRGRSRRRPHPIDRRCPIRHGSIVPASSPVQWPRGAGRHGCVAPLPPGGWAGRSR